MVLFIPTLLNSRVLIFFKHNFSFESMIFTFPWLCHDLNFQWLENVSICGGYRLTAGVGTRWWKSATDKLRPDSCVLVVRQRFGVNFGSAHNATFLNRGNRNHSKLKISSAVRCSAVVAAEWRRMYPQLREMPCPADIYSRYMQEDTLSEDGSEEKVEASADEEISLTEPGLDSNDYDSDWLKLRTKLQRLLGYERDLFLLNKTQNMWQANLEIETIDWSIVFLNAFVNLYTDWTTGEDPD